MKLPKSILFLVLLLSALAIPAYAQRGGGGHVAGVTVVADTLAGVTVVVDTRVAVATPAGTMLELPGDTTAATTTADTMAGVTGIMAAATMGQMSTLDSASAILTTVTAPTIMVTRLTSAGVIHTTATTPTTTPHALIITDTTPTFTAATPPTRRRREQCNRTIASRARRRVSRPLSILRKCSHNSHRFNRSP